MAKMATIARCPFFPNLPADGKPWLMLVTANRPDSHVKAADRQTCSLIDDSYRGFSLIQPTNLPPCVTITSCSETATAYLSHTCQAAGAR